MARIYIAAKFERRVLLRPIRDQLWKLGHEVVSTWLDEVARSPLLTSEEFYRKLALKDFCEISAADLLIIDTEEQSDRGGANVEFGFALGLYHKKLCWVVGPPRNVFHQLADRTFPSWDDCIEVLSK